MKMNNLLEAIDTALIETDILTNKSKFYTSDTEPIKSTKYVLNLLRDEVKKNDENINIRVLRAMRDLGMSAYKDFENTSLEVALNNVIRLLYDSFPQFKTLQPLRMDFGKEYPI